MTPADVVAEQYKPAYDGYDLSKDPRCLWGWGPPMCDCMFGHACMRALGHAGRCHEPAQDLPCASHQRPKDWDTKGREEANR